MGLELPQIAHRCAARIRAALRARLHAAPYVEVCLRLHPFPSGLPVGVAAAGAVVEDLGAAGFGAEAGPDGTSHISMMIIVFGASFEYRRRCCWMDAGLTVDEIAERTVVCRSGRCASP